MAADDITATIIRNIEKLFGNLEKDAIIYVNKDKGIEKRISYREFINSYNKFINFLRSKGKCIYNAYEYEYYPVYQ